METYLLTIVCLFCALINAEDSYSITPQSEPIRINVFRESRGTTRFMSLGPVMFRHYASELPEEWKDIITEKTIIELVELGRTNGSPRKAPMEPYIVEDITGGESVFSTKEYLEFDTYALIELVFCAHIETVALTSFKSNGCYYLEDEILTDDVGLYDYLANHICPDW